MEALSKEYKMTFETGDQDWWSFLSWKYPELFYILPCRSDRQTGRQEDRKTERHAEKKTSRPADRGTDRQTEREKKLKSRQISFVQNTLIPNRNELVILVVKRTYGQEAAVGQS